MLYLDKKYENFHNIRVQGKIYLNYTFIEEFDKMHQNELATDQAEV